MKQRILTTCAIVCAAVLAGCGSRGNLGSSKPDAGVPPYSVVEVRTHVDVLAHDSMLGRLTSGPGIEMAARYINGHFARLGLGGLLGGPRILRYEFGESKLAPNVVATIRGSTPGRADSMIVLVAHFDHVGTRSTRGGGDSIFNGADDNASGTAALLEAARLLKMRGGLPYTVVFAAVSGEESGLVGSRVLLQSGRLDAARVVAAINMDMVGRGSPSNVILVAGPQSFLGNLAFYVARKYPQLGLAPVNDTPRSNMTGRSDHGSFIERGVPTIGLFTGLHGDYHKVSDSADRIDADKVARIAAYAVLIAETVGGGRPN